MPTPAEIKPVKPEHKKVIRLSQFHTSRPNYSSVKTTTSQASGSDLQAEKKSSAADYEYASKCISNIKNNLCMDNSEWANHWATKLRESPYATEFCSKNGKRLLGEIHDILINHGNAMLVAPILISMLLEQNLVREVKLVSISRICALPVREKALLMLAEHGGADVLTGMSKTTISLAIRHDVVHKLSERGIDVPAEWLTSGANQRGGSTQLQDEGIRSRRRGRNGRPQNLGPACGNASGESVLAEPHQKEESIRAFFQRVLTLLKQCMLDDANDLLDERRPKLVEWLTSSEHGANVIANEMDRMARLSCDAVPNHAKFLIDLLVEAKRFENVRNIAERSSSNKISAYARKCLK